MAKNDESFQKMVMKDLNDIRERLAKMEREPIEEDFEFEEESHECEGLKDLQNKINTLAYIMGYKFVYEEIGNVDSLYVIKVGQEQKPRKEKGWHTSNPME